MMVVTAPNTMVERELTLTKRPDSPLETSTLPDIALHDSAERDFQRAIGLAQSTSRDLQETTGTLVQILRFQGQTDIDATPLRSAIQESLSKLDANERPYITHFLAGVEIGLGNIPAANAALEATGENDAIKEGRSEARLAIAEEQLRFGDIEGALETAEGSEDNILIAEINARVAIYKAEKEDEDPASEIERTLSLIPTIESDWSQGLLYSILGRAKALNNEDPKPMFVMAMEKALSLEVSEDQLAELFTRFIADVDASGFDATPVFNVALEWADRALEEKLEPGDISSPEINQGMAIEAIIEQQINLGYLEMAEQTLSSYS